MTVTLHPDDRRLLQEVTALLRGVLAALPRPVPPGDWGRSHAAPPERAVRRVHEAPSGPIAIESRVPRPRVMRKHGKHTPESIARDAQEIAEWLRLTGVSRVRLAAEAGMNATLLSNVTHLREGLSVNARAKFTAAVERLRRRRAAR